MEAKLLYNPTNNLLNKKTIIRNSSKSLKAPRNHQKDRNKIMKNLNKLGFISKVCWRNPHKPLGHIFHHK